VGASADEGKEVASGQDADSGGAAVGERSEDTDDHLRTPIVPVCAHSDSGLGSDGLFNGGRGGGGGGGCSMRSKKRTAGRSALRVALLEGGELGNGKCITALALGGGRGGR